MRLCKYDHVDNFSTKVYQNKREYFQSCPHSEINTSSFGALFAPVGTCSILRRHWKLPWPRILPNLFMKRWHW